MSIQVKIFGSLTDLMPAEQHLEAQTTQEIIEQLILTYPAIRDRKYVVAVNTKIVQSSTALHSGDTVALMPPFSGG